MLIARCCQSIYILALSISMATNSHAATGPKSLTLSQAEFLALQQEPELLRLQANANALTQQAVVDRQLSDPQLMFGAINVPTDNFSFTQDEMTMLEVGVEQSFPTGHSRAIKSRQTSSLATAERFQFQNQKLILVRNVRETWLDLYYWTQAQQVIEKNLLRFAALLKTIQSQYSLGKNNLSDVAQAKMEYSRLEDQKLQILQQIDVLRAQLGRWIGFTEAERSVSPYLPQWQEPPSLSFLQKKLLRHPALQIATANIQAAKDEVALAQEQYKPDIKAGVAYGFRQGNMSNGMPRSNMITGQLAIDLPLFTAQHQDRRVKASTYRLEASQLERTANYRNLVKDLQTQYAFYQQLSKRMKLYQQQLVPIAIQNEQATLLAYQTTTGDLATVLRAQANVLSLKLEQLQVEIARTKARAALLYFEGWL